MQRQTITVGTDGQIILSPEMQAALAVCPGSQVEIFVENQRMIIQRTLDDRIKALHDRFSSGPSLEDELRESRKNDWK